MSAWSLRAPPARLLVCGVLAIACTPEAPTPTAPPAVEVVPAAAKATGPSLVLVTLDTTRADHMGAYGYAAASTLTFDQMAAGGMRFERAYAAVPLTTPSHATMLSGLYPPRHGVHNNGDATLPDGVTTLAEVLQARGYRTAASVSAFVTQRVWNLDQGFDTYFDEMRGKRARRGRWGNERPADEVVDDLTGWLGEDGGEPFFVWAHFYDPHAPHNPPQEFQARFPGHPYDAEIAFVDSQINRLKEAAEKAAGPAGVAWIIVADHGEAFEGEHNERDHGLYLYDPTMHVPFVVRPAQPLGAPVVVADRVVSGVDVMPTALGLLGVTPPVGLDGVDLTPLLNGGTVDHDGAYMESRSVAQRFGFHPELAWAQGSLKLMDTPSPRLFDLAADPLEVHNVFDVHGDDVAAMRAHIEAITSQGTTPGASGPAPEVQEQLAALGYIGGDLDLGADASTVDAKDRSDTILELERVRARLTDTEQAREAETIYRGIIAREPELTEARTGLARALVLQGRAEEALVVYEETVARTPDSAVLRMNYSNALALAGRNEEALAQSQKVLEQVPGDEDAEVATVRILSALARSDEGVALAKQWLTVNPAAWSLHAQLGIELGRRGQFDDATGHLDASLNDGVPRAYVFRTLAQAAQAKGETKNAADYLRRELLAFPGDHEARMVLGKLLMDAEAWEEAASEFRFVAEAVPENSEARRLWAQGMFNEGDYPLAAQVLAPLLDADEPDAYVLLLHANILDKQGDAAGAAEAFERAQELKAERDQQQGFEPG